MSSKSNSNKSSKTVSLHRAIVALAAGAAIVTMATAARADNPQHSFSWDQEIAQTHAADSVNIATSDATRTPAAHTAHASALTSPAYPFSLHRLSPDEEAWDPTYQMDPHIGRSQSYDAPN